jgi:hypothetical protein
VKRGKHHFWLAMLFLIFGVALRETPEIMSLTDDWSNDGTAVSFENPVERLAPRSTSTPPRIRKTVKPCLSSTRLKKRDVLRPFSVSNQETGKSRLHFLSIQRL